jgi:hypothetical protein
MGGSAETSEGGFDPGNGGGDETLCVSENNEDADGDGFSVAQGDCNDCDANVSPGAVEVLTPTDDANVTPADENCNGQTDEPLEACDSGMLINDSDPLSAAAAIELCQNVNDSGFGVVDARWVRADGSPATPGLQAGIMSDFGPNVTPRGGDSLLVLSSGHARRMVDADACGDFTCEMAGLGVAPTGFPQDVPSCSGSDEINDDVALEVELKAPTNATGYSFDFSFYSFEFPEWVCTSYNDQFIALMDPAPEGSINGNVSFDTMTNPVSVNIAFFQVCQGCTLGTAELQGTGFDVWDDAGATGWLATTAPVEGGDQFKLRFAIWDTGDQSWDSTVIVDNFQWVAETGTVVGTAPIPK